MERAALRSTLHLTYELYLNDGGEAPRFEALTCPSDADVLAIVRAMIAERGLASVEVRRLGEKMFTVEPAIPIDRGNR